MIYEIYVSQIWEFLRFEMSSLVICPTVPIKSNPPSPPQVQARPWTSEQGFLSYLLEMDPAQQIHTLYSYFMY